MRSSWRLECKLIDISFSKSFQENIIYITKKCHKLLGECFTTANKKEPRAWEGLKPSSSIQ